MNSVLAWAQTFALSIGGPGLFLMAVLDSSFLSLPEINDILIVLMVTAHKEWLLFYVLMATLGSVVGDLILYAIARKGGDAMLRKRFKAGQIDRARATFQRFGLAAVMIPSALPPPMPFKLFVLAAGVARMRVSSFALSVMAGRGARYLLEGLAAYYYGAAALDYMHRHGGSVAIALAVLLAASIVWYCWWNRRDRDSADAGVPAL
jgi:membrane protein YqaA with SNARE-associated domain